MAAPSLLLFPSVPFHVPSLLPWSWFVSFMLYTGAADLLAKEPQNLLVPLLY